MSQRRLSGLKWIGVVIFVVLVLIITAPASLISEQLKNHNQVQFSGISGKLHSGHVQTVLSHGLSYQNLTWELNVLASLTGALSLDLQLNDSAARLSATTRIKDDKRWALDVLTGRMDIDPIANVVTTMSRFGINGELEFNAVSVAIEHETVIAGSGSMAWRGGHIKVNNIDFDLGQINADVRHTSEWLILDFKGTTMLAPSGSMSISPSGKYELDLFIEPGGLPDNAKWLANMGKRSETGQLMFNMKGNITF